MPDHKSSCADSALSTFIPSGAACMVDQLGQLKIFANLSSSELRSISHHFCFVRIPAGNFLRDTQNPESNVFFIVSGEIKVITTSARGKEVCFGFFKQSDMFGGVISYLTDKNASRYLATESCCLIRVRSSKLISLMVKFEMTGNLLKYMTRRLQTLGDRIYEFSALSSRERTRLLLLKLAKSNPSSSTSATISELPTHEDIANMIASHREAVTKELSSLRQSGIIIKRGNSFILPNIMQLQNLIPDTAGL